MKRFKQSKGFPAGFAPDALLYCQRLLANQPFPTALHWNEHEVFGYFDGWWLSSDFTPQAAEVDGRCQLQHYAARLRIHGQFGQSLPAGWLFAMNYGEHKTVALLQLIRVLHLLNHLGRNGAQWPLRIDLDPRICHAFSERIIRFTADLLAPLQLASQQVLLLLFIDRNTTDAGLDLVRRYRDNGHLVGLGGFGDSSHDLLRLWRLEPDFIALSSRFMRRAVTYPQVRTQLQTLMPQLVEQGFALAVEDIVCANMMDMARQMGASHYAGPHVEAALATAPVFARPPLALAL